MSGDDLACIPEAPKRQTFGAPPGNQVRSSAALIVRTMRNRALLIMRA
jgi:hypothetical protein